MRSEKILGNKIICHHFTSIYDTAELSTHHRAIKISLEEQTYGSWGEGMGQGIVRVWDRHVHTAMFNMDNQQGPTV